jgi:hypothetical protein
MQLPLFIPAISPRTIKEKDAPLCHTFQPGLYDVICQRGKHAYTHIGNRRFRIMIENQVAAYANAPTKVDKSLLVISIVDTVRQLSPNGGFVRFCKKQGCYVEIGDNLAREKVGHALREIMNGKKKSISNNENGNESKQKALEAIKSISAGSSPTPAPPHTAAAGLPPINVPSSSSAAEQQIEPLSYCQTAEPLPLPAMDAFATIMSKQQRALREPDTLEQMQFSSLATKLSNLRNTTSGGELFRSIDASTVEDDEEHERRTAGDKYFLDLFQF